MTPELFLSGTSVVIAALALGFSSVLLLRQNRQLEHERNAMAMLEAARQLNDPVLVRAFEDLEGIERRFPDDEAVARSFDDSSDDRALLLVGQYVETIACLARRGALDPSLLVDAVGFSLRARWTIVRTFVERLRRVRRNPNVLENFEWLVMYYIRRVGGTEFTPWPPQA